MEAKVLEIRDRATYIPVIAAECYSADPLEQRHFRRAGFGILPRYVIITRLDCYDAAYDPYRWETPGRTMFHAHTYIAEHFDELEPGDVIDVEFILGETLTPKQSDC